MDTTSKTMDSAGSTGTNDHKLGTIVSTLMVQEPDNSQAHALAANVVTTAQQHATLPPDHPAHSNFSTLLKFLLAIAPAIASPFIKNAGSRQIFEAEAPLAGAIAEALP